MPKDDSKKSDAPEDAINKKYGIGTIINFAKMKKIPEREVVSLGCPSLNFILGKGVPIGRIMEIYGPESSGKTTLCLYMLKYFQEQIPDKRVAYIDVEHAMDLEYAKALGIDLDKMLFSQPDTGEQALDIIEKLCQSEQVSVIVLDSIAQLIPMAVAAKEIDGSANMATTARLLGQTLPRLGKAAAKSGTTLIFINQVRMNIGAMYGNPEVTTGGLTMKYSASIRLEIRARQPDKDGDEKPLIGSGIFCRIKTKKNKLTCPQMACELFLEWGKGFDEIRDTMESALKFGIIEKKGGWYNYGTLKEQGWTSFVKMISKDTETYERIFETLKQIK